MQGCIVTVELEIMRVNKLIDKLCSLWPRMFLFSPMIEEILKYGSIVNSLGWSLKSRLNLVSRGTHSE